jgi:hypothetical protein
VFEAGVRQIVCLGLGIFGQAFELELGENEGRQRDRTGRVGDFFSESLRFECADDARGNRAELLVKMEAGSG